MRSITQIFESFKGISGVANVLVQALKDRSEYTRTMDVGDFIKSNPKRTMAVPVGYDLWYLWTHANFMARYYTGIDGNHYDYTDYMNKNLSFLKLLPGIKPLKILRDLRQQLISGTFFDAYSMTMKTEYKSNGIYWINTLAFEIGSNGVTVQYPSDGSIGYKNTPGDYVGYLAFPVGQLGVQEVISLMQETELSGYKFTAVDSSSSYYAKAPVDLQDRDKPSLQDLPSIFPDMKDGNGNQLAGLNYCYGRHLVESAYRIPIVPAPGQNTDAPAGETIRQASADVELFSSRVKDYPEDVRPKLWARYWIHKSSTLPVPGEFIGILCRPVASPPHIWWFQESSPFVYAGNWVETSNLTSGIVTKVVLEGDRSDSGIGNQYYIKVQGCEVIVDSSDFFSYSVGDRVAVLKVNSTLTPRTTSFRWLDQPTLMKSNELAEIPNYVILPMTFYKKI